MLLMLEGMLLTMIGQRLQFFSSPLPSQKVAARWFVPDLQWFQVNHCSMLLNTIWQKVNKILTKRGIKNEKKSIPMQVCSDGSVRDGFEHPVRER
jgi:hypothetical protein